MKLREIARPYMHTDTPGVIRPIVQAVCGLYSELFPDRDRCPFHLAPCGRCHAPVWQQPCPVCGYYPAGDHDEGLRVNSAEWLAKVRPLRVRAHDLFKQMLLRHGNIAAWYFEDFKQTAAYPKPRGYMNHAVRYQRSDQEWRRAEKEMADQRAFADRLHAVIEKAKALNLPSAEQIWHVFDAQRPEVEPVGHATPIKAPPEAAIRRNT